MHLYDSGTDLRVNSQPHNSEIVLWPSFTDIMTVILMIFMLTMVLVIIKNANLADELTISQQQRIRAAELMRRSRAVQAALQNKLAAASEKLRQKEMQIILLTDETDALQRSFKSKSQEIEKLEAEIGDLAGQILVLRQTVESQEAAATAAEARVEAVRQDYEARLAALKQELDSRMVALRDEAAAEKAALRETHRQATEAFNRKVADLLSRLEDSEAAIVALGDEKEDLSLSLAKQRQAYSSLEDKYIKLIRPARSPAGKKVVTVQYQSEDGQFQYLFKGIGEDRFERLSEDQLHQRLGAIKEELEGQLYVKIIIPENSGLTYNDAWTFTKEILSSYDYYYQD